MERIFCAMSRMFFVLSILDILIIRSRSFLLSSAGNRAMQSSRSRSSSSVHDGKAIPEPAAPVETGDPFPPEDETENCDTEGGGFMCICCCCCCCCCSCCCTCMISFYFLCVYVLCKRALEREKKDVPKAKKKKEKKK